MPKVIATPFYGFDKPLSHFKVEKPTTDDLPSDVIGEAVTESVHRAWKSGIDPALEPFFVAVTFE